jgi:Uma2 family endonuclease
MATTPQREGHGRSGWPGKGKSMTEDAYHELERLSPDRKYEYIDGMAYMLSGGSVAHDRINRNISYALDRQFRSGSCTVFGVDVQVLIGTKRNGKPHYVYPDATVSCARADRRPDNTLITVPRLVVEVLSPGTEVRDRGIKMKAYQQCPTMQEIVLVSQFAQHVETWQRSEQEPDKAKEWAYRHYGPGEVLDFASIAVQVEIGEFYRGLEFDEGDLEDE